MHPADRLAVLQDELSDLLGDNADPVAQFHVRLDILEARQLQILIAVNDVMTALNLITDLLLMSSAVDDSSEGL